MMTSRERVHAALNTAKRIGYRSIWAGVIRPACMSIPSTNFAKRYSWIRQAHR